MRQWGSRMALRFFWIKSKHGSSPQSPSINEIQHKEAVRLLSRDTLMRESRRNKHRVIGADGEGLILYNTKNLSWPVIEEIRELIAKKDEGVAVPSYPETREMGRSGVKA